MQPAVFCLFAESDDHLAGSFPGFLSVEEIYVLVGFNDRQRIGRDGSLPQSVSFSHHEAAGVDFVAVVVCTSSCQSS